MNRGLDALGDEVACDGGESEQQECRRGVRGIAGRDEQNAERSEQGECPTREWQRIGTESRHDPVSEFVYSSHRLSVHSNGAAPAGRRVSLAA